MKRIIALTVVLLTMMSVQAQTQFRKISFQEALAAAKAESKLVFIDFYTSWCGPCKRMAREVFPTKQVGDVMNKSFVALQIDAEKGEGVQLAKKYKIKAYPTFVVTDAEGNETNRTLGYYNADAFVPILQRFADKDLTPEKIKARYESGERNGKIVNAYASLLAEEVRNTPKMSYDVYEQKMGSIKQIVQDYYATLSDADKLRPENEFVYRQYTSDISEPAAQFLAKHVQSYSNRAEADSLLDNYCLNETADYLSGKNPYDAKKVNELKADLTKYSMTHHPAWMEAINVIQASNEGDDKYLDAFTKCFKQGDEVLQGTLLEAIGNHFDKADDSVKKKASRAVRTLLPDMSFASLYSALQAIGKLENVYGQH
jgi:thioredoxin-related protein